MARHPSVKSESALFFETFRRAAAGECIRVPFREKGQAVRFQQRMHTLRRKMEREHHELFSLFDRVLIRRPVQEDRPPNFKWVVVVEPRENDFAESLIAAGVTLESIQFSLEQEPIPEQISPENLDLENVLKDLYK